MEKFVIAIHGGAGTILKKYMTAEMEQDYLRALQQSLDAGYAVLQAGGTAVNAVRAAVIVMEDNILFNAGRGSVFNSDGGHEMDAAIMDGIDLRAGAVSGLTNVRNPIEVAIEVMMKTEHVFLSGEGANEFAAGTGAKMETEEYFFSELRFNQWKKSQETGALQLDHTPVDDEGHAVAVKKFGTVGAVACDLNGNIAAATSTGGMTNKRYGRIGDSPIIGAGTYANDKTCAISCTGHGEPFIKAVAAYDVSCLMEYRGLSLEQAMKKVVLEKLVALQGEGGMIGVDCHGNVSMIFNSEGMYRGYKTNDGSQEVAIYK
jgi:beta-aspartyl-peptidase (threonine type)